MKRFIILISVLIYSNLIFSQNRNGRSLKRIDTAFKPTTKQLAINKIDNTIIYWNGSYWTSPNKNDSTWSLILGPLGRRKILVDSIQ